MFLDGVVAVGMYIPVAACFRGNDRVYLIASGAYDIRPPAKTIVAPLAADRHTDARYGKPCTTLFFSEDRHLRSCIPIVSQHTVLGGTRRTVPFGLSVQITIFAAKKGNSDEFWTREPRHPLPLS